MKKYLYFLFLIVWITACQKSQPPDPRIDTHEKELKKLSEQNEKLETELRILKQELAELSAQKAQTSAQTQEQQKPERMTVERAKRELDPLLRDSISKMRKQMETPSKGKTFGMRVQYDVDRAIYGLINTDDPAVPYRLKVIVRYEKFLESEKQSKSYGNGSTTFLFAKSKGRWTLEKSEES